MKFRNAKLQLQKVGIFIHLFPLNKSKGLEKNTAIHYS